MALQLAAGAAVLFVARRGPRARTHRRGRRVLALGLGATGAVLGASAGRALGPALSALPHPRPDAPLVGRGPYRTVRHPMYTSLLALAAAAAAGGSDWALAPAAVLALVLDRKAAREEAWLAGAHPSYARYRAEVRWRFVPGLR